MNEPADWRLHGAVDVDVVSETELQIRVGGKCTMELVDPVQLPDGRILALPIPNATAMLLHASKRAYDDAQRLLAADHYQIDPRDTFKMSSSSDAVDALGSIPCGRHCFSCPHRMLRPKLWWIGT